MLEQRRKEALEAEERARAEERERTEAPDDRPVIWDASNRRHLQNDHPERNISLDEINQALANPERGEKYNVGRDNHVVIAPTDTGRMLQVVWVDHVQGGRYPIHALEATRKLVQRWEKL